jgi:hypothetical protein
VTFYVRAAEKWVYLQRSDQMQTGDANTTQIYAANVISTDAAWIGRVTVCS